MGLRLNSFFEKAVFFSTKKKKKVFLFFHRKKPQQNSENVVVKRSRQRSGFQHDGGDPQEDAADEEGEGRVCGPRGTGRREDEGTPRQPQGARRRDQLPEQEDPASGE